MVTVGKRRNLVTHCLCTSFDLEPLTKRCRYTSLRQSHKKNFAGVLLVVTNTMSQNKWRWRGSTCHDRFTPVAGCVQHGTVLSSAQIGHQPVAINHPGPRNPDLRRLSVIMMVLVESRTNSTIMRGETVRATRRRSG